MIDFKNEDVKKEYENLFTKDVIIRIPTLKPLPVSQLTKAHCEALIAQGHKHIRRKTNIQTSAETTKKAVAASNP
jgi:hypothetical protein